MNVAEAAELNWKEVLKETDKACQIKFSSDEIHWIPKSQCRFIGQSFFATRWIMEEKGLENFELPR
jgi:hypothetical protein